MDCVVHFEMNSIIYSVLYRIELNNKSDYEPIHLKLVIRKSQIETIQILKNKQVLLPATAALTGDKFYT
jgi:hypothetical protein